MPTVLELQRQLAATQAELDNAKDVLGQTREQVEQLRMANEALQGEIAALQVDKDRFTEFEAMQIEHDKNLIRIEAMKRYLTDKDVVIDQLTSDVENEKAAAAHERNLAREKEKEARGFERQLLKMEKSIRKEEIQGLHQRLYQTRQQLTQARLQIQELQS